MKGPSVSTSEPQPSLSARAVQDTTRQFAAQMVVGICAAFCSAWINRLLPTKELAVWPVALQVGSIVAALSSWGIGDAFVRLIPGLLTRGEREETCGLLRGGLLVNGVGCVLVSLVVYWQAERVGDWFLHDRAVAPMIRLMAGAALFMALQERLSWAVTAVQEFRAQARMTLVIGVLRTPTFLAAYLLAGLGGFLVGMNLIALLGTLWAARIVWPHLRAAGATWSPARILRVSWPYYGVSLLSLLEGRINYLLIGAMTNPDVLAAYFVADSVVAYLRYLGQFATNATAPKLSERALGNPEEASRVLRKCTRYVFLGALPVYVTGAALSPLLIQAYGGAKYAHASLIATILCLSLLLETTTMLHEAAVRAFAKPWHAFASSGFSSVFNLGPLVTLVPAYGSVGAALAAVVKYAVMSVVSAWILSRNLRIRYDWGAARRAFLACIPLVLVGFAIYRLWGVRTRVLVPAGLGCMVAYALGLTHQLTSEDVNLLQDSLPGRLAKRRWVGRLMAILRRLWVRPEPAPKVEVT